MSAQNYKNRTFTGRVAQPDELVHSKGEALLGLRSFEKKCLPIMVRSRFRRFLRHIYIGLFVTNPRIQFHILHRHDGRGFCV